MTGHAYRRYRYTKRTHRNQYLGPFIKHEMNRCIAVIAASASIGTMREATTSTLTLPTTMCISAGRLTARLRVSSAAISSKSVRPGVFTDKTLSSAYNRKWDMRSLPSVCVHCGVGCNTNVSERAGQVRRILASLQRRGERLFSVRSRSLRLRFCQCKQSGRVPRIFVHGAVLHASDEERGTGQTREALEDRKNYRNWFTSSIARSEFCTENAGWRGGILFRHFGAGGRMPCSDH